MNQPVLPLIDKLMYFADEYKKAEFPSIACADLRLRLRDAVLDALAHPPAADNRRTPAAADVLAERRRQVDAEGWTPQHDDEHTESEMALAASCYAATAGGYAKGQLPPHWPWAEEWFKPTYGRRDLVKAGALILAEIERLDRAALATEQGDRPDEVVAWRQWSTKWHDWEYATRRGDLRTDAPAEPLYAHPSQQQPKQLKRCK